MFIYKITNLINGKVYIGQTTWNVQKRWNAHCRKSGKFSVINQAINKYKKENFKFETLETCSTLEDLNNREIYWISYYNSISPNGYNLELGGSNKLASEDLKRKLSIAKLGKKYGRRKLGSGDNISIGKGSKTFLVFSEDKIVGKWSNKSTCAKVLNLQVSKICACLSGKRYTHKGYRFILEENYNG